MKEDIRNYLEKTPVKNERIKKEERSLLDERTPNKEMLLNSPRRTKRIKKEENKLVTIKSEKEEEKWQVKRKKMKNKKTLACNNLKQKTKKPFMTKKEEIKREGHENFNNMPNEVHEQHNRIKKLDHEEENLKRAIQFINTINDLPCFMNYQVGQEEKSIDIAEDMVEMIKNHLMRCIEINRDYNQTSCIVIAKLLWMCSLSIPSSHLYVIYENIYNLLKHQYNEYWWTLKGHVLVKLREMSIQKFTKFEKALFYGRQFSELFRMTHSERYSKSLYENYKTCYICCKYLKDSMGLQEIILQQLSHLRQHPSMVKHEIHFLRQVLEDMSVQEMQINEVDIRKFLYEAYLRALEEEKSPYRKHVIQVIQVGTLANHLLQQLGIEMESQQLRIATALFDYTENTSSLRIPDQMKLLREALVIDPFHQSSFIKLVILIAKHEGIDQVQQYMENRWITLQLNQQATSRRFKELLAMRNLVLKSFKINYTMVHKDQSGSHAIEFKIPWETIEEEAKGKRKVYIIQKTMLNDSFIIAGVPLAISYFPMDGQSKSGFGSVYLHYKGEGNIKLQYHLALDEHVMEHDGDGDWFFAHGNDSKGMVNFCKLDAYIRRRLTHNRKEPPKSIRLIFSLSIHVVDYQQQPLIDSDSDDDDDHMQDV